MVDEEQRLGWPRRTGFNTKKAGIAGIMFHQRRDPDALTNGFDNTENGCGPKGKAFGAQRAHPLFVRQDFPFVVEADKGMPHRFAFLKPA